VSLYTIDSIDELGPVPPIYAWRRVRQTFSPTDLRGRASIQTP
jgi:hypothetical protein